MNDTTPGQRPTPAVAPRPVLLWHPGRDEPHIKADVAEAARFLTTTEGAVVAAIDAGDLLGGWFVDWAAPAQWRPRRT